MQFQANAPGVSEEAEAFLCLRETGETSAGDTLLGIYRCYTSINWIKSSNKTKRV